MADMFGNLAQSGVNIGTNMLMQIMKKFLGGSGQPQQQNNAYQIKQQENAQPLPK